MGREKTEFAERHQGELLPRRAREYVPPHAVPEQPEARTMENATIKLSPELDPRMQMTVLAARYVQDDRGPWRGLLTGLAIGSALGVLVWFGPWASWFGAGGPGSLPGTSARAENPGGRSWNSLEQAGASAVAAKPAVTVSAATVSAATGPAVAPTVIEEVAAPHDLDQPVAAASALDRGAASAAAVAAPSSMTRPSKAPSKRATRPAPRRRSNPEPRADDATSVDTTVEPTPSGNRVWLAPKERKVWLE